MATHSSVLAWRIPWTGEPGGLPSMGSHRVWHDWSDLAAAAAAAHLCLGELYLCTKRAHRGPETNLPSPLCSHPLSTTTTHVWLPGCGHWGARLHPEKMQSWGGTLLRGFLTYRSQISFLKMKTSGPLQSAFLTAVRQKALLMNSGTSRGLLTSFGYNQSSPW